MSKLDYSPLWATMKEKGVSQYRLLKCGVDNKTLDTLKKGGNITSLFPVRTARPLRLIEQKGLSQKRDAPE